jgi:hypothetical protein
MNIKVSELQRFLEVIEKNNISIPEVINFIEGKVKEEQSRPVEEEISLTVDYGQTLEQMIANSKYDWHNNNITEKNFPMPTELVDKKIVVLAKLFHFNRVISSEDTIAEMNKDGYRPATLVEILALGKTQLSLQRQFPVIALGSVWRDDDGYGVPYLDVGVLHGLHLNWFDDDWGADCRFLAVRK